MTKFPPTRESLDSNIYLALCLYSYKIIINSLHTHTTINIHVKKEKKKSLEDHKTHTRT